jgi:membrane-associated protease RseP (regulator of RpoE activity)
MSGALGVIAFVVLMLFAIGFHEFGHFVTARWAGIKVSKFFIGFGPTIWSVRRGPLETVAMPDGTLVTRPETEYGIKALPLGGFVKVIGMSPLEEVSLEDEPRAFGAAPAWKRAIVLAAGSFTHFITAIAVLFLIFTVVGIPDFSKPTNTIDGVVEKVAGQSSPAARAGLKPGDKIVAIDGNPVTSWDQVRDEIRTHPEKRFVLTVQSRGSRLTLPIKPVVEEERGKKIGVIGVYPRGKIIRAGPIRAAELTGRELKNLFVGFAQHAPDAFSPRSLGLSGRGGPTSDRAFSILGAGRIASDLVSQGQVALFLFLFVQINVFVAILNLVPLPPLDGGHLLFLLIEKIRKKPVEPRVVLAVTAVVFSVLLILGVLLVYYDIVSPVRLPVR